MSSRVDEKKAAREARLKAEAAEAARATRLRRVRVLMGAGLVALLAVVVAIAISGGSDSTTVKKPAGEKSLFAGIPQDGLTLGKADAPATLEEFVDPQCPYCKQFSLEGLPTVVQDYVRTGKLKLVVRPLTFIGPDSQTAARTIVAAGEQNQAFPYLELFYANQGPENSGYVTDAFLRRIGGQVKGLDVDATMQAATSDAQVTKQLGAANRRAQALDVNSTPSLVLTVGSGDPQPLQLDPSDYKGSVTSALNAALNA
jgi:protein-disulfide isomerase